MNDVAYRGDALIVQEPAQRRALVLGLSLIAMISIVGAGYAVYEAVHTRDASVSCELAVNKVRGDLSVLAGLNREVPRDLAQRWTELLDKECGEWGQ